MKGRRGFTLLEVLVATGVLAVAMTSLLGLHARNIRLAAETQEMTVAGLLAARLAAEAGALGPLGVGSTRGNFREETRLPAGLADRLEWQREVTETMLTGIRQVRISIGDPAEARPIVELVLLVRVALE